MDKRLVWDADLNLIGTLKLPHLYQQRSGPFHYLPREFQKVKPLMILRWWFSFLLTFCMANMPCIANMQIAVYKYIVYCIAIMLIKREMHK